MNNHYAPFGAGETLLTRTTEQWSQEEWDKNEARENLRVFSNFYAADQGRSRKFLCECRYPEDSKFIAHMCNSHEIILSALRDLLEEFDSGMTMIYCGGRRHGKQLLLDRMEAARNAITIASENKKIKRFQDEV